MKRYLLLLSAVIFISSNSAFAQDYYKEDSVLMDIVNNFVKNTMMQYGKTKPIDSNDLEYLGIMTVLINGGAFDKGNLHMHTDGLLRKVGEQLNAIHDREVQDMLLKKYMDNTKVQSVDDLVKLMKQTSWNKDKPSAPPEKQPSPAGKL